MKVSGESSNCYWTFWKAVISLLAQISCLLCSTTFHLALENKYGTKWRTWKVCGWLFSPHFFLDLSAGGEGRGRGTEWLQQDPKVGWEISCPERSQDTVLITTPQSGQHRWDNKTQWCSLIWKKWRRNRRRTMRRKKRRKRMRKRRRSRRNSLNWSFSQTSTNEPTLWEDSALWLSIAKLSLPSSMIYNHFIS